MRAANLVVWNIYKALGAFCVEVVFPRGEGGGSAQDKIYISAPVLSGARSRLTPIQRADVFRYAVVFFFGGFYADIDVICLRPIEEWVGKSMEIHSSGARSAKVPQFN